MLNEWPVAEFLHVGSRDFVWVSVLLFEKFSRFFVSFFWLNVEATAYRLLWLSNKMLIKIIKPVRATNYL